MRIPGFRGTSAALFCLGFGLLFAQQDGRAQTADALTFFKNYFLTGDYVVGGVGLRGAGVNGIATGTIAIGGVPANADILAAFLYWQVVSKDSLGPDSGAAGATFKGNPLSSVNGPLAKVLNAAGTAPCWSAGGATGSSGGEHRTYTYRADVLRFFTVDGNGRTIVNGAHAVQLPDSGPSGNRVPIALGASLVVVYRDPTMPLSAVVLYDGGYTMDQNQQTMSQTIRGFYQAATTDAKITHIVGSGQANKSERLLFNGSPIAINPFQALQGPSWDNPTFAVTSPTALSEVTTSVDHAGFSTFDCLTWGATIYRTAVQDTDGDGLLDIWEASSATLYDPNGQPLPNLHAMGANPNAKDLFVEIGYMHTGQETTYGGVPKPAHTHLPAAQALKMVGDAFKNAPVSNPDSSFGISVHFDVGNNYQAGEADPYIIPASLARGGEAIDEMVTVCARGETDPPWVCQFSAYPGTVGWKTGLKFLRDQLLNTPPPLTAEGDDPCDAPGNDGPGQSCERRFDRNRKDMFHYVLSAHAPGLPRASCLNEDGGADAVCQQTNPDFHVPRTNSGVGDFPGADLMLTLGAFADADGKPVGTPFMQGSTLMHELGHTFELTHAGAPVAPPLPREPNCKPNYLSVMNYLFQLRGLFNDVDPGVPHMDYSGELLDGINETFLTDGALSLSVAPRYRTGWYAPQGTGTIGSAAKKYCNGADFPNPPPSPMVRVDGTSVLGPIDWNANGDALDTAFSQDINFDGVETLLNPGSNDWATLRQNQLGSRRNVGGLFFDDQGRLALGPLSLDVGRGDIGRGDIGRGDIGRGDIGRGDIGRGDIGAAADEVDFEIATASGNTPPNQLKACVIGIGGCTGGPFHRIRLDWKAPNVGSVLRYRAFRVDSTQSRELVGQVDAALGTVDYSLVDTKELPNATFTYFVTAEFDDGTLTTPNTVSGPSNFFAILAVNDPPVAGDNAYSVNQGTTLNVAAPGVLDNDTDDDSPTLTSALVTPPSHGTLILNADGSFIYTADPAFVGSDSFTYTANDVDPSRSSNVAKASITVQDTTPPVVTLRIPVPNGLAGFFVTSPVIVGVTATDPSNVSAFTCLDNGSPVAVGSLNGIGTPAAGGNLSLGAEGTHSLACTATDSVGNSGAAPGSSNTGTVKIDTQPPKVTITAPEGNAAYLLNASVASSYSCSEPAPGSGLAPGTCVGPVSSGSNFDTATVGPKTFTVTASDLAGNTATRTNNYFVNYSIALTPLKSSAQQGSAVPVIWQLKDGVGIIISSLSTLLKMESVFNGPVPLGGCVSSDTGTKETLYSLPNGATGKSSFRFVASSQSYQFNWDTTTTTTAPIITGKGCYTVLIYLDDQSAAKMTTPVQLK